MKSVWLASPFTPFASIVVENASDWLSHQIKQVDKK